jgi:MFS family permease
VARAPRPSTTALLLCSLALGIGNALNNPVQSTLLPHLVGRRDLAGAVSLQSVQINLSRVVGPAIGGVILPVVHASGVFTINALTYLFVIGALFMIPPPPRVRAAESGWRRLSSGFQIASRDRLLRRILLTMTTMSFLCLPFIGLMPVLASRNLGLSLRGSPTYGLLFACFGFGATVGAISVGTWLAASPRHLVARAGLATFAVSLAAFGANHLLPLAFVLVFIVGACYFLTVTTLSTLLQEHLTDEIRGRVMALWIMAFGGVIPFGLLWAGQLAQRTSMTVVTFIGATVLGALALVCDLRPVGHLERREV